MHTVRNNDTLQIAMTTDRNNDTHTTNGYDNWKKPWTAIELLKAKMSRPRYVHKQEDSTIPEPLKTVHRWQLQMLRNGQQLKCLRHAGCCTLCKRQMIKYLLWFSLFAGTMASVTKKGYNMILNMSSILQEMNFLVMLHLEEGQKQKKCTEYHLKTSGIC